MIITFEVIDFEICCAKTNYSAMSILLSLLNQYNSDYILAYERWQYYDNLIARLKYERERSLAKKVKDWYKGLIFILEMVQPTEIVK